MKCLFCESTFTQNSIEHIVPESLGNKSYILKMGCLCRPCNNLFSEFEKKALGKTMLAFHRLTLGIATKRGKPAKADLNGIKFEGDSNFKKNIIIGNGIENQHKELIKEDGSFNISIKDFDKSEMATCKLILKMGLESVYNSQRKIYKRFDFSDLKKYLTNKENKDWPLLTTSFLPRNFISVPRFNDKFYLKKNAIELRCLEINQKTLIFNFRFGILSYIVNLTNRDKFWTEEFLINDKLAKLYPEYLNK